MNGHASIRFCCGERDDCKGAVQQPSSWHRWLLVCTAVIFTVSGSVPGEAVNGEPVGTQGVHQTAVCTDSNANNFTVSCDDRPQSGVVSCHQRGIVGDEGLAMNVCIDSVVTTGVAQSQSEFLETDVTVTATDFGEYVCGKDPDGRDFCLVCDSFKTSGGGASHCVKIVNNQQLLEPATCGAYNISKGTSGDCLGAELDLQQSFSDPHVGFTIGFNGSDAGDPGQKDIMVCGARSWQCISDRSLPPASEAEQLQQQQTHWLMDTPCCVKTSTGGTICDSRWKVSAICK